MYWLTLNSDQPEGLGLRTVGAALHSFKAMDTRARTEPARILSYGTNTLQIGSFSLVIDFFTTSSRWAGRSERQLTQVS